jgi:uncharacterized protein (UPF0332 family)
MSLAQWAENGWLRPHQTSAKEIDDLLRIIARDLQDAAGNISTDWQFGIAYNAALKLCTILLYVSGYKPEKTLQHYRTIQALPLILGQHYKEDAKYLDTCRNKRNIAEYDYVGAISSDDVIELIKFVNELRQVIMQWLKEKHPQLVSGEK